MKIVFFGSSCFSLPVLRALAASPRHSLVGVVAQPDRPSGRNRAIHLGVVHEAARERGIPVITPEKVGSEESLAVLRAWRPDAIAVASYGQYIPGKVLTLPPLGVLNVHPSLLPKYRGAAPLQWSIARGEAESGVTIFDVVKEMDAGDILRQEIHPILPEENAVELSARFSVIGADLLLKTFDEIEDGTATRAPQNHAAATYAPKINKTDGRIDWRRPARDLHNLIRGFQPWPGGCFIHDGTMVKVWRSACEPGAGEPGQVISVDGPGPLIAAGDGALRLLELQPEGKKIMTGRAFLCGHPWKTGMALQSCS